MFRLRLVSNHFGVDEKGPLYPTREQAVAVARWMLDIHPYPVRAEIRQFVDDRFRHTRVVEVLENR